MHQWTLDHQRSPPYFYMRVSHIILLFTAVFLYGCASNKETAKIFGNMTYFVKDADGKRKADLVRGRHQELEFNIYYGNRCVYGDFNHDGLKDAAVILIEGTGGNQYGHTLAFLINNGKQLIHQSTIYLDDRAIINSMREKNGKVFVDMYVHQEGDCMAGPTKRVRNVYEYDGPEFDKLKVLPKELFCLSPSGWPG